MWNLWKENEISNCLHSKNRQRNVQLKQMIVQLEIFFRQYLISYEIQLSHHFQFRFVEIILGCLRFSIAKIMVVITPVEKKRLTVGVAGKYPDDDGTKSFMR